MDSRWSDLFSDGYPENEGWISRGRGQGMGWRGVLRREVSKEGVERFGGSLDNVADVVREVERQSNEVLVAVGVPRILDLEGEVPRIEGSLDEAAKRAVACPIILPEIYGFFISNQPPSAHITNVAQETQLELYLDEPRVDRNAKLDILAFWKGSEFQYPELVAMARDILSIPISTIASESTFSVGGQVIDQFRSALKPNVVDELVCTRDWLYADIEFAQSQLEDLIEDIMNMKINKDEHKEDTSSMEPSMDYPVS
ncbi:hypothetical protein SO802_021119 [Lithocarpus litseifolius]|uniref:HAT C-terminal dimerisation domain-containing protein n=1 Tax=Lithocarpus litseifolius TaxID=425828 RepID=A0AAW2CFG7_9ROSI